MGGSIVEDRGRTGVRHAGSSCPTGGCGELPRLPWPAAHSGAFAPAGARKWVGIAAEIIPKESINAGQSLSQPAADSSLYTREPLGTGDADCRVGPAGLLAMTMVFCHSEERSDVGIRPFYDGRGFGPPRSAAPTESPINHPSQPSRSEAAARDGRESAQRPSQKGERPRDRLGSA